MTVLHAPYETGVSTVTPSLCVIYLAYILLVTSIFVKPFMAQSFLAVGPNGKRIKFIQYADAATCIATSVTDA